MVMLFRVSDDGATRQIVKVWALYVDGAVLVSEEEAGLGRVAHCFALRLEPFQRKLHVVICAVPVRSALNGTW